MITIREAKKIAESALRAQGLVFEKLTAQTVSFSDLARASRIFVKVHSLDYGTYTPKAWETVCSVCRLNGFSLE